MNHKSKIEELSKGFSPETLPKRGRLTDEQYAGYLEVYQYAINAGAKFPEVVATQWALESGWGTKPSGTNNLFGVKTRSGEKGTVRTTEEDLDGKGSVSMKQEFLDYDTPEASINDRLSRKHWKAAEDNSETAEEYINYLTFINNYATDANYDTIMKDMVSSRHGISMEKLPRFSKDPGEDKLARRELFLNQYKEKQARNGMLDVNIKKQQDPINTIPSFAPAFAAELQGAYGEEYTMSDSPAMSFKPRESSSHIGNNTSTLRDRVYNPFNSEEEVAQMSAEKKNLVKQREEEFNFKGTPILNPKNMLAERSFKYGGALTEFNTGGTHSENPLGGIPQGQTPQGPNLVEEGETKYNDYIFSNSLYLSEQDVKDARLDKKLIGLSIAEASKVLNKFLDEAPFDKITRDTVNEQLDNLTLINERYIAEHDEEENASLMNDPVIAEQAMQEELAMEEMAMQEQEGMSSPEELIMQDQQFMYGGALSFSNSLGSITTPNMTVPTIGHDIPQAPTIGAGAPQVSNVDSDTTSGASGAGEALAGIGAVAGGASNIISNFSGNNSSGDMAVDALGGASAGASAGMAFGPVGAAVGGGLGAISGIFGSVKAKRKAQQEKEDKATRSFNDGFINEELTFSGGGKLDTSNAWYYKYAPDLWKIINERKGNQGSTLESLRDNFNNNILPNIGKGKDKNKDDESLESFRNHFENNILPNIGKGKEKNKDTTSDETVIDTPARRNNQATVEGNQVTVEGNQDNSLSTMIPSSSEEQQESSDANITNATPSNTQGDDSTVTVTNGFTPSNTQGDKSTVTKTNGFTPRNNTLGNILRGAPIANSLIDVLNKEKPDHVSYQLSDYKYQPSFVDEQAITNNIRQGSANTLRSLEQSGLSSGQLAAAKLGMGANSVNSLSDAYLQINDRNNAERARAQDIDYQVQASNLNTTNRQIEDNMQADAMARDINRTNRNTLVNNISELGTELSNTNTAFNVSRGYTQSGQYNPYAALFRSKKDTNTVKKRGGRLNNSIFVDDDADSINLMDNLIKSFKKNGK